MTAAVVAEDTPPDPLRIVEALLFIGGQPLKAERVCEIIRGLSVEQFVERSIRSITAIAGRDGPTPSWPRTRVICSP